MKLSHVLCTVMSSVVASLGCAADVGGGDRPDVTEDDVKGGAPSPASDNNVVYISRKGADGKWVHGGTGTIIGPHHVLTARHVTCKHAANGTANVIAYKCVENYLAGNMGIQLGQNKTAAFSSEPALKPVQVLRFDSSPQFIYTEEQTEDVAILRFSETLVGLRSGTGEPIYPTIVGDLERPTPGSQVRLVGWGKVDAAGTPAAARQTKTVNVVSVAVGGTDQPHEKALMKPASGQCPGDSGGPYFLANGRLGAVVSTGASCGGGSNRATLLSGRVGRWVRNQL